MSDRWCNAVGVLKAETRGQLAAQFPSSVTSVLDGWCATNPKQVKAWEADGTLMSHCEQIKEQVISAQEAAAADGIKHLSSHEINELYSGPNSRL
jgi:hypothetical protein